MDIARLGFVVETRSVKSAVGDLDRLDRQAVRTERSATRAASNINGGFSRSMAGVRRAAFSAAGALGMLAGALSASALLRTGDQYVEMANGLRVLGFTAEGAAEKLAEIGDIARRTRTPLRATAQLYQRISIASKELGATQADVLRFTENVGLALAQQGGSAEAASGALLQLSQAIAGGVVRAEEFNSILEGAYPIAQAAANGIDAAAGSVARLRSMVIAGQVTSKQFFDAVMSQSAALEAAFAGTVPTVGQAMQVLRDQWTLAVGQMTGATTGLSAIILRVADAVQVAGVFIADNMNQITGTVMAAAGALTAYFIPAIYGALRAVTLFGASLVTLRGALMATGIGAVIVLAGYLIGKFLDLVEATGGFGAALSALGELAQLVWQGMVDSAAAIPPALAGVWNQIRADFYAMISDLQWAWANFLRSISSALSIDLESNITGAMKASNDTLGKSVEAAGEAASAYAKAGEIIAGAFAPVAAKMEELRAQVDAATASTAGASVGAAVGAPGIGGGGGAAGSKGGGGGGGGASQAQQAADKAADAIARLREEHQTLQAVMGMTEVQERAYRAAMDLGAAATAAQRAEVMQLVPEIDRLEKQQQSLRDRAQQVKDAFGELFTGIVTGAKSAKDAVADLLGKLAEMLANQAFNALWGAFSGSFGRGDPLSAALAGAGVRLATGGHVTGGGWAKVGERGPELVRLPTGSTVYDSRQTKRALSGEGAPRGVNVHVTVGMDESGNLHVRRIAQQEAASMGAQIHQSLPQQVAAIRRDPRARRG